MTQRSHPGEDELSALMHGSLDAWRAEELLDHVEACDLCLAVAEDSWRQAPGQRVSMLARDEARDLPALEHALLRRLHAMQLAEQATRLATSGFLHVALRLMAPLVSLASDRPPARRLP